VIPTGIRLYTWVDVEEVLLQVQKDEAWPEWLVWAQAYWDGLTLGIHPDKSDTAIEWLYEKFDPRFDKKELAIKLESVNEDKIRKLNVLLEETTDEVTSHCFVPSFARPMVIRPYTQEHPKSLDPDSPPVIAFHSFKGGVGRTLHALALALAIVKKGGTAVGYVLSKSGWGGPPSSIEKSRVLIVDADLEAPGLSWLVSKKLPKPPVSFVDFLALVHSDPDPLALESTDLVANRLKDALVDGVYILPAFRSPSKFNSLEIRPEHLIQGSKDSFILTTMLSRLGKALNVDAVIVDLRAGISELSSGLLLDPRVYRVLVTTLSGQSMEGTCKLLELLGELAPSKSDEDPIPALILSQIPPEYKKEDFLDPYFERLLDASKNIWKNAEDDLTEKQVEDDSIILLNYFDSNLRVLPNEWDGIVTQIKKSDLFGEMSNLIDWLPELSSERYHFTDQKSDLKKQRGDLAKYAKQLVYAEAGKIGDFLAINPLHDLVSNFSAHVPIAIIIGAKGSGKTYTYLQITQRKNWAEFAKSAGSEDVSIDAFICPILKSKNLEDPANKVVNKARTNSSKELGFSGPCDITKISDYLRDGLKKDMHEGQWREYWLNILAWSLGFEVNKEDAGRRFADYLRERKQQIVAIIDGLEDLFLRVSSDENQQRAVRSLLQDVPEWLEQQPSRPIGLLVFIRQDMVLNAVKQNYSQLIAKYDTYSLKWNDEEALRLVTWIATKANILDKELEKDILKMNKSKLTDQLIPLWGRKLGSENSREARSANWVITALSDLKGQIQARDVVRFLYIASQASTDDIYWEDRLIVPSAARGALSECSKEKLNEIEEENEALGDIFSKLRALDEESKQIPFTVGQAKLDPQELKLLENNGVVLREDDEYYMPEIFRLGLNFKLKTGVRPRVLSLARRAKKWSK